MQPAGPIELVTHTNTVVEVLKLVASGLIGLTGALIGAFAAARTARKAWEWDAKRDGYLRLFPKAHQLGDQAGLVVVAGHSGAGDAAVRGAQEKYRQTFAAFSAAAVVARVTASAEGEAAINALMGYARAVLNPFIVDQVPDAAEWTDHIQAELSGLLDALEAAARVDLQTNPPGRTLSGRPRR